MFLVEEKLEGHTDVTQHYQSLQIDVRRRVEETRIGQTYANILSLCTIDSMALQERKRKQVSHWIVITYPSLWESFQLQPKN